MSENNTYENGVDTNNENKTGLPADSQSLHDDLVQIKEDMAYLRDLFVRRLNDDKQKNVVIQKLAEGATFAFVEPFLYDIILLLDRLEKSQDDFVISVKEELYGIINRRGVEIIEANKKFDPTLHKAVKVVESNDADELHITDIVRNGYVLSGKVIRPAEVVLVKPSEK